MSLIKLYLMFVKISVLTFGGGYAMIPLFQEEIVTKNNLMTLQEFANLVSIAQITPGPVGLNSATFIGMTQRGILGALAATLGVITPALILTMLAAVFLKKMAKSDGLNTILSGVRPCVLGIIASAVIFFADTSVFAAPLNNLLHGQAWSLCWQGSLIFALVIYIQYKYKLSSIWILLLSASLGMLLP